MKPLVGIISRRIKEEAAPWYPTRQGVIEAYISAVVAAGGLPIVVPLVENRDDIREIYQRLDGIILAGGGDVKPSFYGEEAIHSLDRLDPHQDEVEIELIKMAQVDQKPILGICRGLQVINVALGGSLYQHLEADIKTHLNHNISFEKKRFDMEAHKILLEPGSNLARTLGMQEIPINSLHHQAVKAIAPSMRVSGYAEDGVIEAIESKTSHYIVGIQGHPEWLLNTSGSPWIALFEEFVEQSSSIKVYA